MEASRKPRSSERVPRTLTGTERVQNGYRTGMGTGTRVERQQNAFCQAFPVRFLLIRTVKLQNSPKLLAYMLDIIVMQMNRVNHGKGYCPFP